MRNTGQGVREMRIHVAGELRLLYIAKYEEAIYVLLAFQKKSRKASKTDVNIAQTRFRELETRTSSHYPGAHLFAQTTVP
jgi:phage-related protein